MKRVCSNPECHKGFRCSGICRDIEKFRMKDCCYCNNCLIKLISNPKEWKSVDEFRFPHKKLKVSDCYNLKKSISKSEINIILIADKL